LLFGIHTESFEKFIVGGKSWFLLAVTLFWVFSFLQKHKMTFPAEEKFRAIALYYNLLHEDPQMRHMKAKKAVVETYGMKLRTLESWLEIYQDSVRSGDFWPDFDGHNIGNKEKQTFLDEELAQDIRDICNQDGKALTSKAISAKLQEMGYNASRSSVSKWLKELDICKVKNYIKPLLTEAQKRSRVEFVLSKLDDAQKNFVPQDAVVHIDETWFFRNKSAGKVYQGEGVAPTTPIRCKHKNAIEKVMFLVAIGKPNPEKDFDGKIGCWPIVEEYTAKRNSKNHDRGEVYLKPVNVNGQVFRDFMTQEGGVLDMIKEKMGGFMGDQITIQYDGAKPHTAKHVLETLKAEGVRAGWNIQIEVQPPQSPDLNKLDLAFFHSLKQTAYHLKSDEDGLEGIVEKVSEKHMNR
jgi:hypothetical protein